MPHEDDVRVKNIFRRIGDKEDLKLRVFDRSSDDNKLWKDNGLTFTVDDLPYGSGDGAWYSEEPWYFNGNRKDEVKPVIVVEGTFGPERGNVGSAQYARFSHVLGPAMNGIISIYLIPNYAVYRDTIGKWRYDMVLASVNASLTDECPGKILMIDAYKPEDLEELVNVISRKKKDEIDSLISHHLTKMSEYGLKEFNKIYKTQCKSTFFSQDELNLLLASKRRYYAYADDQRIGKIMMFNSRAFTDSSQRNGHTILGDALVNRYWLNRNIDIVFPRFNHEDIEILDERNSKEWKILRKREDIKIVTLDDLDIEDEDLYQRLTDIKWERKIASIKTKFIKQLKKGFKENKIQVV